MTDSEIIRLFFARSEKAIRACKTQYGRLCRSVAMHILGRREDAEEAESDTYLKAWNAIPPEEPARLGAYLAAVCRRLSIDRLRADKSRKRGGGDYRLSVEELDGTLADLSEGPAETAEWKDLIERFLDTLSADQRRIFLLRYWWTLSVKEVARETSCGESAVKMSLSRSRAKLREFLEKEGY